MAHTEYTVSSGFTSDVYIFIDKRDRKGDSSDRFCKSIFPKRDHDFTEYQAKWTLLYKEKISSDGTSTVLYKHNNYDPT